MVNNSNKNCYDDLLSDDIGPFGSKNYIRINPFLILTIGKTIALTIRTFSGKIMSLLFNTLSQFSSVQFSHSVVSDSL